MRIRAAQHQQASDQDQRIQPNTDQIRSGSEKRGVINECVGDYMARLHSAIRFINMYCTS